MRHLGNALGPHMWLLAAVLGSGLRAPPLGKDSRQLVPGLLPTPYLLGVLPLDSIRALSMSQPETVGPPGLPLHLCVWISLRSRFSRGPRFRTGLQSWVSPPTSRQS